MPMKTKEVPSVPSLSQVDLRLKKLDQDWPRLCDEYFSCGWKAASAQNAEDREAHHARMAEIISELQHVPYRTAFLDGQRTVVQDTELRADAASKRAAAESFEQRARDAEKKMDDIADKFERAAEASRIASLRAEAHALRTQADTADSNSLFARQCEGPQGRIHHAQKQIAKTRGEWEAKSRVFDDHSRRLLPGPNSAAECDQQCAQWQADIDAAQHEIDTAAHGLDPSDPTTWPGAVHAAMNERARSVQRQIEARLREIRWTL